MPMNKDYFIYDHLYVGTLDIVDYYKSIGYSILGACKEPLHRKNARLYASNTDGYISKCMKKTEPEYLWAERKHALYLNLIDARDPKYILDEVMKKGISFIEQEINDGRNVAIICNKAESRSPTLAFLYLLKTGVIKENTFMDSINVFINNFYKKYRPGSGIFHYSEKYWSDLQNEKKKNTI